MYIVETSTGSQVHGYRIVNVHAYMTCVYNLLYILLLAYYSTDYSLT